MTDGSSPAVDYGPAAPTAQLSLSPRTAGRALYAALATLALSTLALSLYFGGAGDLWGPVNDVLVAATVLLLLPAIVVVRQLTAGQVGGWLTVLTIGAMAGVFIMAAGQLALVARLIELEASFVTGTVGVLMAIAWLAGTGVLALRTHVLGRAVGWSALGFIVAVIITSVAIALVAMDTPTLSLVFGGPLLVTLVGWMISLGRDLTRRVA